MTKRLFDLGAAVLALVVTSPVFAAVALLVRVTSPGPVFHRATRVGRDGAPFTVLKFRTMHVADEAAHAGVTSAGDPRITGVGRFLRRSKLDELPQLVNVVRGDMSLVGPRPEDPRYVQGYTAEQREVLTVRPGITSPASIAYRDEEALIAARGGDVVAVYREEILPAKLAIDLEYVRNRSFLRDVAIIVRTVFGMAWKPRR